ncbi:low-affinity zinc ion transporter-like protein [Dothidotthia symphoricarpi CBS 119687]|uniref:Low-affinity zinc ion transporter-like protein n=1 Tax=Dothidotthia symphoricarpi CBS 119687 TaxID=1392245 RepID=A0A6A6ALH3_9PLEO|nr:low-affinity zinc ion transporter-like protein [Dothidotthia symphoricarpi CBS 119687]KAF2132043.1 low-affinity zinc ion transporter-like protein [Dothidotthia symphoricarpi CBS 119687]
METVTRDMARLVLRQEDTAPVECSSDNDYDGRMALRISTIFVIFVGSTLGAVFPIIARRQKTKLVPEWVFFIVKYFGSGIIIATAFIHLLAPANEALSNPCLTGTIVAYPWAEGIPLIVIFMMLFLELMTMRFAKFGGAEHSHSHSHSHSSEPPHPTNPDTLSLADRKHSPPSSEASTSNPHVRGDDHLGHQRDHIANEDLPPTWEAQGLVPETYAAQLTAIFILEFGVIFHSIFIGLTLAVAGDEFVTLYVVLVFHQTFEGLGLGTRLAEVPWPRAKRWTPFLLAVGYGVSTPIAIAVGLGARQSIAPGSRTTLIVNGVFDSISGGILIYTGLIELMAHEFMFSPYMQNGPLSRTLWAFGLMMLGAGIMALLGYWA